jgi:hypothetical protein
MNDELTARQRAISLRLAGRPVQHICSALGRTQAWFHKWWRRYLASLVFKAAGNRLDKLFRQYDAWLIVPMHDAYVFEAPFDVLETVAKLTGRTLCETVEEYFPCLRPRVEINTERPECWNKDGNADSLKRWMHDPTFTL